MWGWGGGLGGVCQAPSNSPGGSAQAFWPPGGKTALPGTDRPTPTAAPRSQVGERDLVTRALPHSLNTPKAPPLQSTHF